MTNQPELHIHVWKQELDTEGEVTDAEIVEEFDMKVTGLYDDHIQFGAHVRNGDWLELRLWTKDLKPLMEMVIAEVVK